MSNNPEPEDTFDIVFTGDLVGDVDIDTVKEKAAQLFRLNDGKLAALFSGKRTKLKKNIDGVTAKKYQKILNGIGMVTVLQATSNIPVNTSSTQVQTQSAKNNHPTDSNTSYSTATSAATHNNIEPPTVPKPEKREVSGSASESVTKVLSNANWDVLPVGELGETEKASYEKDFSEQNDVVLKDVVLKDVAWEIDKPGVQLSEQASSIVSDVNVPDITVAPVASDLFNHDEKGASEVPAEVSLDLSSIESMTIALAGDDLLSDAEKSTWTELSVDLSHLSAEKEGVDLLAEDEKTVFVEKILDISSIKLVKNE